MASADRQYVGKERQRVANVIASITAAENWTELRDRDGTGAIDPRGVFREVPHDDLLRLRGVDIHRAFSVRIDSTVPHDVQTVGRTHDVDVLLRVQVGRYVGGGARLPFPSSPNLGDEASAQDVERIVQKLTDPRNRDSGLTGPIYASLPAESRRVRLKVTEGPRPVLDERPADGGRQIWQVMIESWVRVWTEPA